MAAKSLAARGDGDTLMPHIRKWMVFGLLLTAPILLAETPSTHHKSKKHVKHVKPLVLPPLPSGALSQLPMDLIPAAPATVSYEDGLLSISAQNSTLWDILRDVRRLTGASIDMPAGPGVNERVIAHLGPGAPRDVLAVLLNGTSFNYVMLGSNTDPGAVTSLALSPKPLGAAEPQVAAVYQNNTPQPPIPFQGNPQFRPGSMTIPRPDASAAQATPTTTEEEAKDDAEENADDNADDQAQPAQPDAGAAIQNQQPDPNQPNAGPKTPEQILEMLRRQQQMQPGATIPGQPPQQ